MTTAASVVRTVKLDPITRDLYQEDGNQVLLDGLDAIRQTLLCRLRTFLGEVFTDPTKGVPWLQSIIAADKSPRLADVGGLLRRESLTSPGIAACGPVTVTVNHATRGLAVSFTAKATTGEAITVENEVLA